jgi:general secretion pathway protein A
MYMRFFGLTREPFNMTPDPAMLYLTPQHREALAGLMYAINSAKGLVVLTGDAGTGKTTLLAKTLQGLPPARLRASVVVNPLLTSREFLETALIGWGTWDPPESKAQQLLLLRRMLEQARADNQVVVLVVDEAHLLSADLLEEIRLLGNFEQPDRKLLQIVLAGQSELNTLLDRGNLRQFKQRIAVRLRIEPLQGRAIDEYIRYRWTEAGGSKPPFTAEAYERIAQSSGVIPRVINALCDNGLTLAFAKESRVVAGEHIREACHDLDLPDPDGPHPEASGVPAPDKTAPDLPDLVPATVLAVRGSHGFTDAAGLRAASISLQTLERYGSGRPGKSFWSRCAGILGFAH